MPQFRDAIRDLPSDEIIVLRKTLGLTAKPANIRTLSRVIENSSLPAELRAAIIDTHNHLFAHKFQAEFGRSFSESKAMKSAAAELSARMLACLPAVT